MPRSGNHRCGGARNTVGSTARKSNSQITSPALSSPRLPNWGTKAGALLLSWGLTSQPRSPKRLGHRIAAGGPGIASACTRLGGSETLLRSRWGGFGACRRRPRSRGFLEPHRQRDPRAFRLDFQDLDTDDIAGLRDLAWVVDVSIGHRGDVHQPVLVDPDIDKGAECGDVRHDTFENHAGPQILELFHALSEARRLENRSGITSGLLEFPQDVSDRRHPEHGIGECLRLGPA